MFPLRDHNPSRRTPYVTWSLMAINIAIFLSYVFRIPGGQELNQFFATWGMQPAEVMAGTDFHTLLTSTFLHAGWMHIAGNMMFLFIFGDNMEDALGHVGFLLFYLLCGIGANLIFMASAPESMTPAVGASGAVAGVLGGYLLFYPKAEVDILVFLVVFVQIFTAPAWLMLGAWFGLEAYRSANPEPGGNVAHWAHTGGFAIGLLAVLPLFFKRGGFALWRLTRGHPPHAPAEPLRIVEKLEE